MQTNKKGASKRKKETDETELLGLGKRMASLLHEAVALERKHLKNDQLRIELEYYPGSRPDDMFNPTVIFSVDGKGKTTLGRMTEEDSRWFQNDMGDLQTI